MTNKTEKNKIALITGASSGIGKEMARIHAERGGDLVIIATRKNRLDELKLELEKNYSVKVMVIAKDLTQPDAPKEIYEEVKTAEIKIDYLINNAGFGGRGQFIERDWNIDLDMIKLNVIALTALTKLFLPDLLSKNSGKILRWWYPPNHPNE